MKGAAQLKLTQAKAVTQVTECVPAVSACVRSALQSVTNIPLLGCLGCWASKASTCGCATVCHSAVSDLAHNLAAHAGCRRRRFARGTGNIQRACGELCRGASGLLVAHVRRWLRAGACMRL
eukprot:scaffold2376_cov79-Phaeocystis_antarctica.AAC.4